MIIGTQQEWVGHQKVLGNKNIKRWLSEQNKNDFSNDALSELKL